MTPPPISANSRIVIAGGSGFIGRHLAKRFRSQEHDVVVLTRTAIVRKDGVREVAWDGRSFGPWTRELDGAAAVVNLTGKSVNCRHTDANRREIIASRVDSVRAIADARSITITPYEKNLVGPVEKAILASDLGLTPTTVGNVIRINLPPLTEERRKELSKHVSHEGENAKVAVRNVRRDALHHVKELLKEKKITEDENTRAEDEIQKLTDKFVKDVDGVVKLKEDELMAM